MTPPYETVREQLTAFAVEHGADPADVIARRSHEYFGTLPERYRAIAERAWLELPADWDSHAHVEVVAGSIPSADVHLAGARLDDTNDDTGFQQWTVTLVTERLDACPDDEVRAVLVHELAHVASALPTDRLVRIDLLGEDRADAIMRWWGVEPRWRT